MYWSLLGLIFFNFLLCIFYYHFHSIQEIILFHFEVWQTILTRSVHFFSYNFSLLCQILQPSSHCTVHQESNNFALLKLFLKPTMLSKEKNHLSLCYCISTCINVLLKLKVFTLQKAWPWIQNEEDYIDNIAEFILDRFWWWQFCDHVTVMTGTYLYDKKEQPVIPH